MTNDGVPLRVKAETSRPLSRCSAPFPAASSAFPQTLQPAAPACFCLSPPSSCKKEVSGANGFSPLGVLRDCY